MLWIWASEDWGILSQEEQCLLRREGDLDVPEANQDAWLSGRCLVLLWSGSAEVQSQCPPGLCSQWTVARSISEGSTPQPALLLPLWAGPSFHSVLRLSLCSAGYLVVRVLNALALRHWMQMTKCFPNPGSPGGHRPCLDSNTLWRVQLEPSISLLELRSQESNPGSALFPRHCSILAQGLLCFNSVFKFIGSYLHLASSVTHHSSPLHHGEGIRKWISWLQLYIFIVISSAFNPDLSFLLSSVPQGKALALSSEISWVETP